MPKTSKSQKKAVANYNAKKEKAGYRKLWIWIKPEWKIQVRELLKELEEYKG